MTFWPATILLLLVMDPLGNIPVFLAVLQKVDPNRRRRVLVRELLIALAILLVFLCVGRYVMDMLHIEKASLRISGGIVLLLIALRMIFPCRTDHDLADDEEPFIVPLAMPMVAGPSAMATVVVLSSQYPGQMHVWFAAVLCAWAVTAALLLLSGKINNLLGSKGLRAVERLMGMVLVTVSVQMFLDGLREWMPK